MSVKKINLNELKSLVKQVIKEEEAVLDVKQFIVGKDYRYSEIPEEDTEDFTVSEYGPEYLGQNAIHIRYHKTETDVWFVWDKMTNEGIFKCVYNS